MRRAFQVAGARTVVMSLWQVEDRSARVWTRALYEGRLVQGLDTADAVREASLSVLRDRRARQQSTHPFYWAGLWLQETGVSSSEPETPMLSRPSERVDPERVKAKREGL